MSIAVLISGRGSNLRAIADAGLPVSIVISNRRDAPGLRFAEGRGIPTAVIADEDYASRDDADTELAAVLAKTAPRIVALAGFMRILGGDIVRTTRMINIHPSLLPKYKGLCTHRHVLAAGEKEHGCTIHHVSEGIDEGDIIAQQKVTVLPDDDEESLSARVLAAEHKLYPQVLRRLLSSPPVLSKTA